MRLSHLDAEEHDEDGGPNEDARDRDGHGHLAERPERYA